MSDPVSTNDSLVQLIIEKKFGLKAFSFRRRPFTLEEFREKLSQCLADTTGINPFMSWNNTYQGHKFWSNYMDRQEPYLSEGREILKEALQMACQTKDTTEYL